MAEPVPESESRTREELRSHYEVERELALRLRTAPPEERGALYSALYDELYRRVPLHPQLTRKNSPEETARRVRAQMRLLRRFLRPGSIFLEIGPGDCALSLAAAEVAREVWAVDVSGEITKRDDLPPNLRLVLSDGAAIPVAAESVDLAYSHQLLEHLHPGDALRQVEGVCRALVPSGRYLCVTPNRLSGPHDISRYFSDTAEGLHLKEYAGYELARLFRAAGFSRVSFYAGGSGCYLPLPASLLAVCEAGLERLPKGVSRRIARSAPGRALLGLRAVAVK